jgi:RNA polymerase sigma factor (TIGR02999 family)
MHDDGRRYDAVPASDSDGSAHELPRDPSRDPRFAAIFDELRQTAHRQLRRERPGHTLSTTALVNESWLRLQADRGAAHANLGQLHHLAARAMRRVLVDYARARRTRRRGQTLQHVSIDENVLDDAQRDERLDEILMVDDLIEKLKHVPPPRLASVVELRVFSDLPVAEIATTLGVTERTIMRDLVILRGKLKELLGP